MSKASPKHSSGKSTMLVALATFVSRLLGFARNAVVSALLGQSWKADVLQTIFTIPFNLRKLMAEGALSSAFIPVLSRTLVEDPGKSKARALTRSLISFQSLVLIPFVLLCIVAAEPIVSLLAPFGPSAGLSGAEAAASVAQKHALGVELFRWFMPFLYLVSISAVMMAVLNTQHNFALPALSPILFSLSVILSLALLFPYLDVQAQVPGVLLGGLLQIVLMWFGMRKYGFSIAPTRRWLNADMKETMRKWGPALSISGVALANQQISMTLAAGLREGSAAALSNAVVFWQLPAGVLSASVITVLFPRMSRELAEKRLDAAAQTMCRGLEMQALLLLPAALLLAFLAEPVIGIAFQRGAFGYQDTVLAASVLSIMAWGLFFSGGFNFLQRFFYAKGDFRTPFMVSLVWAACDILCSVLLIRTELGVRGLAVGSAAAFTVAMVVLTVLAWRGMDKASLLRFLGFGLRVALALVPVGLGLYLIHQALGPWWRDGLSLASLGLLLLEGVAACGVYLLGLLALRIKPWQLLKRG